jgi:cytochrome c553
MLNYTANYQAPYRYKVPLTPPLTLEPIGDTVTVPPTLAEINTAAQNTTDLVTFCLDCHGIAGVNSTALGGLTQINWATDVHGTTIGLDGNHNKGALKPPYTDPSALLGDYVLSCLDCHEPHGSVNAYRLRSEVNGVQVVPRNPAAGQEIAADNSNGNWFAFCSACHTIINNNTGPICGSANHSGTFPNNICITCHAHGSSVPVCAPPTTPF